jgi:hypothetical protein
MGAKQAADAAIAFVARWSAPGIGAALNHEFSQAFIRNKVRRMTATVRQ